MEVSRRALLRAGVGGAGSALASTPVGRAVGALGSPQPKARFAGDPGPGRLYYGASTDLDLAAWETSLGRTLSVHRTFHRADTPRRLFRAVRSDHANGRLPHVSTKCPGSWEAIADGRFDSWLRLMRRNLAAVDRPVFLTIHHEPENDRRKPYRQSVDFVRMQTRVIEMFARKAPKVTIVPVLQSWSFADENPRGDPSRWNVPTATVYGVDLYNPFSAENRTWVEFETKLARVKEEADGRPIAIGEFGCREDPADSTRAPQWMADAFACARDNGVVSMSYFNSSRNSPEGSWHLTKERATVFAGQLCDSSVARVASVVG